MRGSPRGLAEADFRWDFSRIAGMRTGATWISVVVAASTLALTGLGVTRGTASRGPELARAPYLGLACQGAAATCNRIGLAVWVIRPATGASAVLLGHRLRLRTSHSGNGGYRFRLYWTAFTHVVSARAEPGTYVRVRIRLDQAGTVMFFTRRVYFSAGWG